MMMMMMMNSAKCTSSRKCETDVFAATSRLHSFQPLTDLSLLARSRGNRRPLACEMERDGGWGGGVVVVVMWLLAFL